MPNDVSENWLEGAAKSTIWSVPELFGFEPPKGVQNWRYDNPIAGFGTSMLGSTIPYLGWFKYGSKIATMEKMLTKAASVKYLAERPTLLGATQETLRFMPFEAARVGVNQAFGSQSLGDQMGSAALNLALAGATGGLIGGITGGGLRERLPNELLPEVDETIAPQIQLRGITAKIATPGAVKPEDMFEVEARMQDLRRLVRGEDPVHEAVGTLQGTLKRERLEGVFNAQRGRHGGPGVGLWNKKLLADKKGGHYNSDADWQNAIGQDYGVNPVQFERYVQYPRVVGGRDPAGALKLDTIVDESMIDIGQGWHMGREANDGLYVMAKKNQNLTVPDTAEYLIFKTDSPDMFQQHHAIAGSQTFAVNAWAREDPALILPGGEINTGIMDQIRRMPLQNYRFGTLGQKHWLYDTTKNLLGYAGVKTTPSQYAFIANVHKLMNKYFTPGMFQTKGKVRATYIDGTNRLSMDYAKAVANRLLHGQVQGGTGQSLINQTWTYSNRVRGTGIIDKIKYDLSDKSVNDIWRVFKEEASVADLPRLQAQYGLSQESVDAMKEMFDIAGKMDKDSVLLNKKYGSTGFRAKDTHFMLRKEWPHDMFIEVRNAKNQLVGLANQNGTKATESIAKKMIQDAWTNNGERWTVGARYRRSQGDILPPELKNIIDSGIPGHWMRRSDVKGFRFDETPFTRDELANELSRAVHARAQQHAATTINNEMKGELQRLAMDDRDAFDNIAVRWNDLQYKPRPLGAEQDKLLDRLMAPMIGPNSATKIVGATNKLMWHLELGGVRMGYSLLNALTPIQTVLPHIAMILNARPQTLGDYYTYFAAMGSRGPVGTVGVLTPMKIMRETLKSMRRPSPEEQQAFNWAMQNGVVAPRVVEEFIGQNANLPSKLAHHWQQRDIIGGLEAMSEYFPAQSEKFSRAFSFVAGLHTGKIMGLRDIEDLQQFAKRFTERTNYLYGQADRAGIMTGPIGGTLGLFKNWMFHYIGNMMEYGGEAMRGNIAPLAWQTAGTFGLGGLAATPILYPAAQYVNNLISDQPLQENLYSMLNEEAADGILFGLPAALAGVSLTSQAAGPFSNPMRDANNLMTFVHADRMKYFAQAFGAAWDNYMVTGQHPGENAEVMRNLVRATMPKSIFRSIQMIMDDTLESWSTGYQIMDPEKFGPLDKILFGIGFSPVEVERHYAATNFLYHDQQRRRALVAAAGKAMVEARENGDSQMMWSIIQGAIHEGLDLSSVYKSAATRDASGNLDSVTRTFSPTEQMKVRNLLNY